MNTTEKNQLLFTQLVAMFHFAAMQQMGKVKNPMTDAIERDLSAAQGSIDVLDMLREKTRGHLSPEEEKFLNQVLQELKLNYVDESSKPEPPAADSTAAPAKEGEPRT
jgi:hypothetical protein